MPHVFFLFLVSCCLSLCVLRFNQRVGIYGWAITQHVLLSDLLSLFVTRESVSWHDTPLLLHYRRDEIEHTTVHKWRLTVGMCRRSAEETRVRTLKLAFLFRVQLTRLFLRVPWAHPSNQSVFCVSMGQRRGSLSATVCDILSGGKSDSCFHGHMRISMTSRNNNLASTTVCHHTNTHGDTSGSVYLNYWSFLLSFAAWFKRLDDQTFYIHNTRRENYKGLFTFRRFEEK